MGFYSDTPWAWNGFSVVEDNSSAGVRVLVNCGTDLSSPWTADTFTDASWFFDIYEIEGSDEDEPATEVEVSFGGVPTWTPENVFFSTEFFRYERLRPFISNLAWDGVADVVSSWEQRRVAFNEAVDVEARKKMVLDL